MYFVLLAFVCAYPVKNTSLVRSGRECLTGDKGVIQVRGRQLNCIH